MESSSMNDVIILPESLFYELMNARRGWLPGRK